MVAAEIDKIAIIARRLSDDVKAQLEPLMFDIHQDALLYGVSILRLDENGKLVRVTQEEWGEL